MTAVSPAAPAAPYHSERTETINVMARAVVLELARLRGLLEPLDRACDGTLVDAALAQEWDIAADGLFGPTGVLVFVTSAANTSDAARA